MTTTPGIPSRFADEDALAGLLVINCADPVPCDSTFADPSAATFTDLREMAYEDGWQPITCGWRCPACAAMAASRGSAPKHAGGEHPAERVASAAVALADALETAHEDPFSEPLDTATEAHLAAFEAAHDEEDAAGNGEPRDTPPDTPPNVPGPPRTPIADSPASLGEGPGTQDRPARQWVTLDPDRKPGGPMLPAEKDRPLPVGDWKERGDEERAAE